MRLSPHLATLELPLQLAGRNEIIYPVAVLEDSSITLIDTGLPGQVALIRKALEDLGGSLEQVRRIILTHQDIDHIGSLPELVRLTGAEVWAHAAEVPVIEGQRLPVKMSPERLKAMPEETRQQMEKFLGSLGSLQVSRSLSDGEVLPLAGGTVVIFTPGHTPGHLSFFLADPKLLVSGDELRVVEGQLVGPAPQATPDMPLAIKSLQKLVGLDIERVLCYHGGLFSHHPKERIAELASQIEQSS